MTRMIDNGLSPEEVGRHRDRDRLAERYFMTVTDASPATPDQDMIGRWDCRLSEERLDVKSIAPRYRFVLGPSELERPPIYRAPVVEVSAEGNCRILGYLTTFQWTYGRPLPEWLPCWYALRSQVIESPTWTSLQAAWRAKTDEELA